MALSLGASAQRTIQLRPRCDTVTINYASGGVATVDVINQPFKVEIVPAVGLPVHPILSDIPGKPQYRYHDGGPKVDLLGSIGSSKSAFAAEVGSAGASATICIANAFASWLSAGAQCWHDREFISTEEYERCKDAALQDRYDADYACIATLQRRYLIAILNCDSEIDLFIAAYQGCSGLDDRIEAWERYWADEQN